MTSHFAGSLNGVAVGDAVLLQNRKIRLICSILVSKIVSEYDQEIPQSQTADNPMATRGRVTQSGQFILTKKMSMHTYWEFKVA